MQTAFHVLTLVLFVILVLLGWFNREAEAVQGPTLFVGVVAALVTLLFGLRPRLVEPIRVPVEYVFAKGTLMPLSCTWFPESAQYSTPPNGAWETGFVTEKAMLAIPPGSRDVGAISRVFGDVLMSQIVDVLSWTFHKGSDSDVMRIHLAGTQRVQFTSKPNVGDVKISREQVGKLFPESTCILGNQILDKMYVPTGTTLARLPDGAGEGLSLRSKYATVMIRVVPQGVTFGQVGRFAQLCRLPVDFNTEQIGAALFVIQLEASFTRLLAGSPAMKQHERWVTAMFESLSTFDSTKRWEKLQADYHLYYSQKTKTVYQELLEAAQRRAEEAVKKAAQPTP